MKIFLLLVILSSSIACKSSSDKDEITHQPVVEAAAVSEVINGIQTLNLPLTFDSQWHKQVEEYLSNGHQIDANDMLKSPYGIVFNNNNFEGVIFISPAGSGAPVLVTLNKAYQPIDTLFLLGDADSNDPNWQTIEIAHIFSNQTIQTIDSVYYWDLNPEGERIEESKKLTVSAKIYRISETGNIQEIEN